MSAAHTDEDITRLIDIHKAAMEELRGAGCVVKKWRTVMKTIAIRDVSLFVKVIGHGYPLVLMHGGPGADLYTLMSFRPLADRFTLVFYDHRGNGRSTGAPVESMNFENLTADADALRQALGFEKWAVLGHSFGGNVALEYALRYPQRLSHLLLVNSGGDYYWPAKNPRRNWPDAVSARRS